jgi:hypothetical protein
MERTEHRHRHKGTGVTMNNNNEIDKPILLEQYKLYVEMADRISQRRQSTNTYFLSVNTFMISFFAYAISGKSNIYIAFSAISIAGWALCYVWYRLIRSYKDLNSGKFKVIHEMEGLLGYAPYDIEWDKLGRGKDKKLYKPFTEIEPFVPLVFAVLYLITILMIIPWDSLFNYVCSK